MSKSTPRRALVSVSDKTGLAEFAGALAGLGFELVSTGGTSKFLKEAGLSVIDVSSYTGFPEIMDGRVKTLHPKVHGAILGRPDLPEDAAAIRTHGIQPFELVVCNLYPFEKTVARAGVLYEEAVEQIDIGGPSMVRSAAKNHAYVGIVTDPAQYPRVLEALRAGPLPLELRKALACAAFEMTARYDRAIAGWFATQADPSTDVQPSSKFPPSISLQLALHEELRYGENPHQPAAIYVLTPAQPGTLATAKKLHGKELSYNNLLDLDAAQSIIREFTEPAAVIIKHNNPCGCGTAATLAQAFDRAYDGDPVSAFGSIIGVNRPLDAATAERLCEPNRFVEAIIAPSFNDDAFALLTTKPKWKANVRLLTMEFAAAQSGALEYRGISGGILVQRRDDVADPQVEWSVVTNRTPTDVERRDLEFAWKVCKHVKSNAITLAAGGMVIGVGAGQMSRLDSAQIAVSKAADRVTGSVAASDAFFPFRDGVDVLAKAGVRAIIQPGGSRGDDEVIAACDEHGIAMIFTGRRHFRH
ncbi:MAG: bifunctional phosphoribosylaminoimidazolecarboxamide formyltransferase/IMP cyclohydrolase [Planctomycetaceae bacterium]